MTLQNCGARLRLIALGPVGAFAVGLAFASSPVRADQFQIKVQGTVTSVDPALHSQLSTGNPFELGFSLDTNMSLIFGSGNGVGKRYYVGNAYFKVGSTYTATAASPVLDSVFLFSSVFGRGPTGQGFRFDTNQMIGSPIDGFPLHETYIDFGFNNPFASANITSAELLSLSGQPVVGNSSSLTFDDDPNYKYVRINIGSISVTPLPEPSAALATIAITAALAATRARTRFT